jgi:hypothetical protein
VRKFRRLIGLWKSAVLFIPAGVLSACTGQDLRQGVYAGMYEGIRIERQRHASPSETAVRPVPDYQQYSRERAMRFEEGKQAEADKRPMR